MIGSVAASGDTGACGDGSRGGGDTGACGDSSSAGGAISRCDVRGGGDVRGGSPDGGDVSRDIGAAGDGGA